MEMYEQAIYKEGDVRALYSAERYALYWRSRIKEKRRIAIWASVKQGLKFTLFLLKPWQWRTA